MTIAEAMATAQTRLTAAGIPSARLDSLIVLEDILGKDRSHLLAHPEIVLAPQQTQALQDALGQRETHMPLAYIRGKAAFYGRDFIVSPDVLVPRPETEDIITLLLGISDLSPKPHIIDVGTGSGCIGITAALELPEARVSLYDIDKLALHIAEKNAAMHGVRVEISMQSLLETYQEADVVLANLPYVPTEHPINRAASHEPASALFAGEDGMDLYRTFWKQLQNHTYKPAHIIVESLTFQHPIMDGLAKNAGYVRTQTSGLIQHFVSAN